MHYLFGYGSIVLQESAERTLGRPIQSFTPAVLNGYERRWETGGGEIDYRKPDGELFWGFVSYLNVVLCADGSVNGVIFEVTQGELEHLFDDREANYRRVNVTDCVDADVEGQIWTYTASDLSRKQFKRGYKHVGDGRVAIQRLPRSRFGGISVAR